MAGRVGGDRRAVRGGWALAELAALVLVGLATLGCASTSSRVSAEQVYVGSGQRILELVAAAVRQLGGVVVGQFPTAGSLIGRFDADTSGLAFTLEVSLEGEGFDMTLVRAALTPEVDETPIEDLEFWRGRFFEALDALAASAGARVGRPSGPPTREPR
jgi:hypothetical protein